MDKRIGFVGLGIMGKPMARNLHEADRLRLALPATSLVHHLFHALETMGAESEGTQALVKVLERLAGVEVKQ